MKVGIHMSQTRWAYTSKYEKKHQYFWVEVPCVFHISYFGHKYLIIQWFILKIKYTIEFFIFNNINEPTSYFTGNTLSNLLFHFKLQAGTTWHAKHLKNLKNMKVHEIKIWDQIWGADIQKTIFLWFSSFMWQLSRCSTATVIPVQWTKVMKKTTTNRSHRYQF